MTESRGLGNFEEMVLLAIFNLNADAYGAKIRQSIKDATGRSVSIGAIYATLDRLERKGLVGSWQGEATPERGGRPKRYFRVENAGHRALYEADSSRRQLLGKLTLDTLGV